MTDHGHEPMSAAGFDAMLRRGLSGPPPEDVVTTVTPWRRAMRRVIIGLALHLIALDFWNLNYLLPAAGTILSLLGFRALRRENGWFRACFFLTLLHFLSLLAILPANATIYAAATPSPAAFAVLVTLQTARALLLLFCLWRGILSVQRKAGLPPHAAPAVWLLLWYALVFILALLHYSGWFALLLIVVYVLLLHSLWRLSKTLDEAGYAIRPVPVRLPDPATAALLAGALILGIAAGYLLFRQYPMDWSPAETALSQDAAQVREQLLSLGFPREVLDDLTEEDILACAGAEQVKAVVYDVHPAAAEHAGGLRFLDAAVQLPGSKWRIIHHFQWLEEPDFYGTECIQLWPAYHNVPQAWQADGGVTGQVLYNSGGQVYTAPYYRLTTESYTYDSIFGGAQTDVSTFAPFSLPAGGTQYRGYLAYSTVMLEDALLYSCTNYTHQWNWMQYPVTGALEWSRQSYFGSSDIFVTVQDALQLRPQDGRIHIVNGHADYFGQEPPLS